MDQKFWFESLGFRHDQENLELFSFERYIFMAYQKLVYELCSTLNEVCCTAWKAADQEIHIQLFLGSVKSMQPFGNKA